MYVDNPRWADYVKTEVNQIGVVKAILDLLGGKDPTDFVQMLRAYRCSSYLHILFRDSWESLTRLLRYY